MHGIHGTRKKTPGYLAYNFTDKDPIIDKMRTMIQRSGLSYAEVSLKSGVTAATLYNWFNGATKKPQFATAMAVIRSLGYSVRYVKTTR